MKVSRLIKLLADLDPNDDVLAYDADVQLFVPVTGLVTGFGEVELQTDSDEEEI